MKFARCSELSCALGLAAVAATSCKSRSFNTQSRSSSTSSDPEKSFDVNDVTYLMALPQSPDEQHLREWSPILLSLSASGLESNGSPILTQTMFKDVICQSYQEGLKLEDPTKATREPNQIVQDSQNAERLERYCGVKRVRGADPQFYKGVDASTSASASFAEIANYDLWKVIGARIEFCFGNLKPFEELMSQVASGARGDLKGAIKLGAPLPPEFKKCQPHLRLVAQPVAQMRVVPQPLPGNVTRDFALHLIYTIPSERMAELAKDAFDAKRRIKDALNVDTSGKPLYVHPSFSTLEINEPIKETSRPRIPVDMVTRNLKASEILNKVILKYANASSLHDAEMFGAMGPADLSIANAWLFTQFVAKENNTRLEIKPITMVKNNLMTSRSFKQTGAETYVPNLVPNFLNNKALPNNAALADHALKEGDVTLAEASSALEASYRVDDPISVNFKGIDCVSCHTGTSFRTALRSHFDESTLEASGLDERMYRRDFKPVWAGSATLSRDRTRFADYYLSQDKFLGEFFEGDELSQSKFARSYRRADGTQGKVYRVDYVQRNFGYFWRFPMITMRSILESGFNAHFANTFIDFSSFE